MSQTQNPTTAVTYVLNTIKPGATAVAPSFLTDKSVWAETTAFATQLGVGSLFASRVSQAAWISEAPESVALTLEEAQAREGVFTAVMDLEFDRAVQVLVQSRIDVLVFGGMDWVRRLKIPRAERSASDGIDLLVRAQNYGDALTALGRAGYRGLSDSDPSDTTLDYVELARTGHGTGKNPPLRIWRRTLPTESEQMTDALWHRSSEGKIPGVPRQVRALSNEDAICYLICKGVATEMLETPTSLLDLHYLVTSTHGAMNWDAVIWSLAVRNSLSAGWFALQFLQKEWGTAIPSEVLSLISPKVNWVRRMFLTKLTHANHWFTRERRTPAWTARTRYLLRDTLMEGASTQAP